jgi:hypothetical protein
MPPPPKAASRPDPTKPKSSVRPEPRVAPHRTDSDSSDSQAQESEKIPRPRVGISGPPVLPRRRSRLWRLAIPLIFAFVCGGMVFSLITVLSNRRAAAPTSGANGPAEEVSMSQNLVSAPPAPLPVDPFLKPAEEDPSRPLPGILAQAVLEKFLVASTLEERLPLMECHTELSQLADSVLAKPLPPVVALDIDLQEQIEAESIIDVFFNVDFDAGNGGTSAQTILVRIRGSHAPKVMADPFLDLFGGRLAAYVATPQRQSAEFRVLANAMSRCWDESVPNFEKKFTLKLLAREGPGEIARGYFGPHSEVWRILQDPSYPFSLSYGQTKACTVVLQWNYEEQPERPYLEVLRMPSLSWGR